MKRLATLILLLTTSSPLISQWERNQKLGIKGGYEWNVFLNPTDLLRNGERLGQAELLDHATYQSLFINNSFKRELATGRLKIDLNISGALYQTQMSANRYTYKVGVSYRTKYAKKKYFEIAPNLHRVKRDGVNQADAILSTPFSFTQLIIPLNFDFYMGNKVWIKTEVGYLYKNYDRQIGEQLFYHAPFAGLSFSKKWAGKTHVEKITFNSSVQLRKYTDIENEGLDDDFNEETDESSRNWKYIRNSLEYNVTSVEKYFGITFGLYNLQRMDADETNSYNELSSGIQLERNFSKLKLSGGIKYSIRNYSDLTPGEGNDEKTLQYKYFRGNFKANIKLNRSADFFTRVNLINRKSNNTDISSRGFRGYFNSYIEAGIVIKF